MCLRDILLLDLRRLLEEEEDDDVVVKTWWDGDEVDATVKFSTALVSKSLS